MFLSRLQNSRIIVQYSYYYISDFVATFMGMKKNYIMQVLNLKKKDSFKENVEAMRFIKSSNFCIFQILKSYNYNCNFPDSCTSHNLHLVSIL